MSDEKTGVARQLAYDLLEEAYKAGNHMGLLGIAVAGDQKAMHNIVMNGAKIDNAYREESKVLKDRVKEIEGILFNIKNGLTIEVPISNDLVLKWIDEGIKKKGDSNGS